MACGSSGGTCSTCISPIVRPKDSNDPEDGISYDAFYRTAYWKITREHMLRMFGKRCFKCGKDDPEKKYHVHHKHYRTMGREDLLRDLEILCANCHAAHHAGYRGKTHRGKRLKLAEENG